jgi:hypothetical protein
MEGVRLSFGAVAMGAKEPSLGDLTAFVREQFGLDPDLDRVAMHGSQLSASPFRRGATHRWRISMLAITSPEGSRIRT